MLAKPLYEILFRNDFGGAGFQFYEIISEKDEFNILLVDDLIKPYVRKTDIETCNFILINLGEKQAKGFTIEVTNIEELPDKIIITIKEIAPKNNALEVTKPCYVIKIKSKKAIEIR